jgi:glycosyltransferase involved in cell wall biosynthesis
MPEKPTLLIATLPHNLAGPQLYVAQIVANPKLLQAFNPEVWAVEDLYRGLLGKWRLFWDCKKKIAGRNNLLAYNNQDLSLVTWLALFFKLNGVHKIATHSHNNSFCSPNRAWVRAVYSKIVRTCSHKKLGVSLASAKAMFGNSNSDSFTVIPALIDFDALHQSSNTPLARISPHFTFACIGRLTPQKNQLFAIEAFSELIKTGIRAHLLIIGDGDLHYERSLFELIAHGNLAKFISIIRATTNIAAIYRYQIDALLVPSNFEGQSRVVAEAQFFGVPVVTSIGIPDIAFIDKSKARTELPLNVEIWKNAMEDLTKGKPAHQGLQLQAAQKSPLAVNNGIDLLLAILES